MKDMKKLMTTEQNITEHNNSKQNKRVGQKR